MLKIATFNRLSAKGLQQFRADQFIVGEGVENADAILLRSHTLQSDEIVPTVKAIGRAGAGVNNIPVAACTARGIPVFNAPGANANAVKELVAAALLLSSRGIVEGVQYVNQLIATFDPEKENTDIFASAIETAKKRYAGQEIAGKTLGVIGLGAIGSTVAQMALMLGMDVVGYDPALSIDAAWRLPSDVSKMENLEALMARSDYVTMHIPAVPSTRHLMNQALLSYAREGCRLINFARAEIVDVDAVVTCLQTGRLGAYVTDFPDPLLKDQPRVLMLPHLGASTREAEDNCAEMVARNLIEFLVNGNIQCSVNFPTIALERAGGHRLAMANRNVPSMLNQVLSVLSEDNINVIDMLNKSRGDIAYTLLDVETQPSNRLIEALTAIDGVINVRAL